MRSTYAYMFTKHFYNFKHLSNSCEVHMRRCLHSSSTNALSDFHGHSEVNVQTISMAASILALNVSKSATIGSCNAIMQVFANGKPAK